jgi:hypothetical protein
MNFAYLKEKGLKEPLSLPTSRESELTTTRTAHVSIYPERPDWHMDDGELEADTLSVLHFSITPYITMCLHLSFTPYTKM